MSHDLRQSGPFLAIGGMAVALFLYAYSAIALPSLLHSLVMPAFWLVLVVLCFRSLTSRPRAVLALPVVALVAWFATMLLLGPRA